ncbi:hypothetical protein FH972_024698 [Carpinus fangiana]|uniref:Uncharacterized protein n=1 Tax=Carpinus fangiana TaxID=176857 RepID=A0A5N6KZM7_9ROSI|nr:hypothetical protein FH972_024698 [Carpinus fangiana]
MSVRDTVETGVVRDKQEQPEDKALLAYWRRRDGMERLAVFVAFEIKLVTVIKVVEGVVETTVTVTAGTVTVGVVRKVVIGKLVAVAIAVDSRSLTAAQTLGGGAFGPGRAVTSNPRHGRRDNSLIVTV